MTSVDLDTLIEELAGRSVRDLFASEGEAGFRKREAEAFVRAVLHDQPIRSSGQDTLTDVRLFEEIYQVYLTQRGWLP